MQITFANRILSFLGILGIPWNSQKFPTMQISSDLKCLELLGISGNGRLQFCEDFEFLGIPRNSQLYKLIPRNSQYFDCEGFKKKSNFKRLKTLAQ